MVLLALTRPGSARPSTATPTGSAVGPLQIQPSEIAKLAIVLWAAHVYAQKDRRLGSLHQIMVPVVPVIAGDGAGWSSSAATSAPPWCCSRSCWRCCGWSARPPGCSRLALTVIGVAGDLAGLHQPRAARAPDQLRRPVQGLPRRGLAAGPRPLRALLAAAGSARGSAPASRSGATCPRRTPTSSSRCSGEELGLVGTLLVIGLFLTIAYAAIRVAASHRGPVRPLHVLRHRGLAARPDDHQRRHGARAAAGDRHPAAAGLVRRLGAAARRWSRSAC